MLPGAREVLRFWGVPTLLACLGLGVVYLVLRDRGPVSPPGGGGTAMEGIRDTVSGWQGANLDAFRIGEETGRRCGDLREAIGQAELVPEGVRWHYFDGLAHGFCWDTSDLEGEIAAIRAAAPPEEVGTLAAGLIIRFSVEARGEPEAVVPFTQRVAALVEVDVLNGARIGLQRARGGALEDALAVAGRYPEGWQSALAEELGWRATSQGFQPERVLALLPHVAESARPAFIHGACRSRWSPDAAWDPYVALLERLSPEDQAACLQAVAWSLHDRDLDGEARAVAASLPRAVWREFLPEATRQLADREEEGAVSGGASLWTMLPVPETFTAEAL